MAESVRRRGVCNDEANAVMSCVNARMLVTFCSSHVYVIASHSVHDYQWLVFNANARACLPVACLPCILSRLRPRRQGGADINMHQGRTRLIGMHKAAPA